MSDFTRDDTPDDRLDELIRLAARDYHRPDAAPHDVMWARIQAKRAGATPVAQAPAEGAPVIPLRRAAGQWTWAARIGALAAVLLIGVVLGRVSTSGSSMASGPATRVAAAPAPTPAAAAPIPAEQSAESTGTATPAPERVAVRRAASAPRTASPDRRPATAERYAQGTPRAEPSPDGAAGGRTDLTYRVAVAQHLARTDAMLTAFRAGARNGQVDAQTTAWAQQLLRTTRLMEGSPAGDDPTMRRLLNDLELVLVQIVHYSAHDAQHGEELDLIEQSIERRGVIAKLRRTMPPGTIPAGT